MLRENITDFFIGHTGIREQAFTEEDVKQYIKLTGDDNAVFMNHFTAIPKSQLKGILVPGLLTEGLIMKVITKHLPTNPGMMFQKDIVYIRPVYVGDSITAKAEIIDIDFKRKWITIAVSCINQHGEHVLKGQVVVLFFSE